MKKKYIADFEVYDVRAADHNNMVLGIFISVEGKIFRKHDRVCGQSK